MWTPISNLENGARWISSCQHSHVFAGNKLFISLPCSLECLLGSCSALPHHGTCTTSLCTGEHYPGYQSCSHHPHTQPNPPLLAICLSTPKSKKEALALLINHKCDSSFWNNGCFLKGFFFFLQSLTLNTMTLWILFAWMAFEKNCKWPFHSYLNHTFKE